MNRHRLSNSDPASNFALFCFVFYEIKSMHVRPAGRQSLLNLTGRAFFWTLGGFVVIKRLSYIYILGFGGGRVKVFKIGAEIEKIVGTYVHFGTFLTS